LRTKAPEFVVLVIAIQRYVAADIDDKQTVSKRRMNVKCVLAGETHKMRGYLRQRKAIEFNGVVSLARSDLCKFCPSRTQMISYGGFLLSSFTEFHRQCCVYLS
jgi:hypothetical protein